MGAYRKPSDWPSVKNMTVYATMQPGWLIAAPSMGTSGVCSASGALEMVKSDAKESIDVCGRLSREMLWICLMLRGPSALSFYTS
jgi:hypothetical protein